MPTNCAGEYVAEPNVVVTEFAFTTGVTDLMSGAAFGSWSAFTSFSVSAVNELWRPPRAAAEAEAAGHDRDDVRAEALDLLLDGDAGAVADRDEDDHRGDADRDPEHRQQRAQPVRQHALDGHPERLDDAHALIGSACGGRAAAAARRSRRCAGRTRSAAVDEMDGPLRVRGDLGLVRDHHDRAAGERSAGRRSASPRGSRRCRGCRSARRRARSPARSRSRARSRPAAAGRPRARRGRGASGRRGRPTRAPPRPGAGARGAARARRSAAARRCAAPRCAGSG